MGAFLLLGICNPDCTVFITVSGAHVKGELGEQAVHLAHPASRWRSGWSCGGIKASVSQRPRCRFMFSFTEVPPFCPPDLAPISLNPLFLLFFLLNVHTISHLTIPVSMQSFFSMPFGRKIWSSRKVAVMSTLMFWIPHNQGLCAGIYPITGGKHTLGRPLSQDTHAPTHSRNGCSLSPSSCLCFWTVGRELECPENIINLNLKVIVRINA